MDAVEDYARRWIKREVDQDPKGKVKTHKYINRENQSTTGKL
jgi:hypothetical protein